MDFELLFSAASSLFCTNGRMLDRIHPIGITGAAFSISHFLHYDRLCSLSPSLTGLQLAGT